MFRHLHEIQTGRTSSISHEILGFDSEGTSVDYSTCNTAEEICENATKLLTFIDLAGMMIWRNFLGFLMDIFFSNCLFTFQVINVTYVQHCQG